MVPLRMLCSLAAGGLMPQAHLHSLRRVGLCLVTNNISWDFEENVIPETIDYV